MAWKQAWGYELAKTKTQGVYRMRPMGYFIRAKVSDATGKPREVTAVLPDATSAKVARLELDALVARAREEFRAAPRSRQPWIDFAVSALEERIRRGTMQSAATIEWWKGAISVFTPAWGSLDVTSVGRVHFQRWLDTTIKDWMSTGRPRTRKRRVSGELVEVETRVILKPSTVNGWLRILGTICNAIKRRFDLSRSPFEGIEFFVEGRAHTRERPNALTPDMIGRWLELAAHRYPQHYAMMLLGFVTGLRPSSMRPLRRRGPEADIDWTTGLLLVRRSHSRKQAIMNRTKQGIDEEIALPADVLAILRAHVDALAGEAAKSDLLFPARSGRMLVRTVLAKPFAALAKELDLPFPLTPKGMRRTFNDAMRIAGTHDLVTRSISGHHTDEMQRRYSTARREEQRVAIAGALRLIRAPTGGPKGESSGGSNA